MIPTKAYATPSAGAPLAPFSFDRRDPGPHDVVIQITHCGVCHTDLHFARNDFGMSLYPMVPGHEIVGIVTAAGSEVSRFAAGDRAGVGCLVDSCRTCASCLEGSEQYCQNGFVLTYSGMGKDGITVTQGGYSSTIVVDERFVLQVSPKMALEKVAPLLCAGITTYSPLRRWNVGPKSKLGVVGLGGLGHLAVKLGASFGAEVTVLSTSPAKEADAASLGAHDFVLTTNPSAAAGAANRFDVVLDTLSAAHDYTAYVDMLKTGGTLVCLGLPAQPITVPAFNIVFTRKCIAGSLIGGLPETQEMLDYCAEHDVTADVEVIRASQVNQAFDRMLAGDVRYRFVIDMASLNDDSPARA